MKLEKILSRFAVKADLGSEGLKLENYLAHRGGWNVNNGTLCVVDALAQVWVIPLSAFSVSGGGRIDVLPEFVRRYDGAAFIWEALEAAGYERLYGLWVPHSNDGGTWIREHAPVSREDLLREIGEEIDLETLSRRLQKIAAIAAASGSPSV